jgi:hypothetical protein
MMATARLLLCALALSGAAACAPAPDSPAGRADGADPALALASSVPSRRYGLTFWVEQQHKKTRLWREAVIFCSSKDPASYPNCDYIRVVLFIEAPPPFPKPVAQSPAVPTAPEAAR